MRRDDLYPCGYDRGRAPIGMPKPQPRPGDSELVARLWRLTFRVFLGAAAFAVGCWLFGWRG